MRIYHNPRCSKSRATLDILREKGVEPEIVEYLKSPPTAREIRSVLEKLGLKAMDITRTGENAYKEKFADKTPDEDELIQAMVEHPVLMQRPIVVEGDKAILGRPPENVLHLI